MSFLVVGLSHRTAPIDLLERVAVNQEQLPSALAGLSQSLGQGVLLSTCNRLEVYTLDEDGHSAPEVKEILAANSDLSTAQLEPHLYQLRGNNCVNHLFRMSSGLDSLVLGERQILSQVQTSYVAASDLGLVRGSLSKLFHQALQIGCRVHRETNIGNGFRSVSQSGAQLASRVLPDLPQRRALILGAGEAGRLAAQALVDLGVSDLRVMNRTFSRAELLAAKLGGIAVPFDELPAQLDQADLVVSATGSPGFLLDRAAVTEAMGRRQGRPLLLVDIAMPRDIDPAVGEIPGVQLFDIESLRMATESTDGTLDQEMAKVEDIVREETDKFLKWCQSLDTVPLISALRDQAEEFRRAELGRTLGKLRSQWSAKGAEYGFEQLATSTGVHDIGPGEEAAAPSHGLSPRRPRPPPPTSGARGL